MTDSDIEFARQNADSFYAALITGVVFALEHAALAKHIDRYASPDNKLLPLLPYTIGTATLGVVQTCLGYRWKNPGLARAFWPTAFAAGLAIGGYRLIEHWVALEAELNRHNGHGAGRVAGARRYASEYHERSQAY